MFHRICFAMKVDERYDDVNIEITGSSRDVIVQRVKKIHWVAWMIIEQCVRKELKYPQ